MARNRMIKPEFWQDEKLARISFEARLSYIGIWNFSDDYGVVKGDLRWLKNNIFPYDDDLDRSRFKSWIDELKDIKRIVPFCVKSESFFWIPKFLEHQKIKKPSKDKKNPAVPQTIINGFCDGGEMVENYAGTITPRVENEDKIREDKIREDKDNCAELVTDYQGIISRVVLRLNGKIGASFRPDQYMTQTAVIGLVDSGFSEDDLNTVIDYKCEKWAGDDKMSPFLRPQTLFGDKFEGYLQEVKRNGGGGENIQIAKLVLKNDGEEAARAYCEKYKLNFGEVAR